MPGTALAVPDDPSHGPLDDGRVRADYMRDCFRAYDDEYLDAADAFEPWRALIAVRLPMRAESPTGGDAAQLCKQTDQSAPK